MTDCCLEEITACDRCMKLFCREHDAGSGTCVQDGNAECSNCRDGCPSCIRAEEVEMQIYPDRGDYSTGRLA